MLSLIEPSPAGRRARPAAADPRLADRYERAARWAGAFAGIVGLVAMLGWILGVEVLKSFAPGLVAMKANTAVCFILLGASLTVLAGRPRGRARTVAEAAALAGGAIALVTLAEYVLAWNSGLDQLLFEEPRGKVGTSHPGRMAPNTALAFVLVSGSLVGLRGGSRLAAVTPVAAAATLVMGFVALLGYMTGVTSLYGVSRLTQMAVPTALAFVALSLALVLTTAERGPFRLLASSGPGGAVARRVIPTLVSATVVLGLVRLEAQQAGLIDTAVGVWLMLVGIIGLTIPVILHLGRSLEREAGERREAGRARAESAAELEQQRRFTDAMLESVSEGVVACDESGVLVLSNRSVRDLHGIPDTAVSAAEWPEHFDLRTADGKASLSPEQVPLFRALHGEEVREQELVIAPVDRPPRLVRVNGRRIVGEGGNVLGAVVTVRDVTASREAEQARRHLAAIVFDSDDAIIGKDLEGRIVSWNRGAERLYGYSPDEAIGQPIDMLVPVDRPDEVQSVLAQVRRGERVEHLETVRVRKDGDEVPVSLTVSPVRDQDGSITGASAIARDISERKRSERELERARDEALEGTRLKSEFLANMSHEIRTPMNGVIGMTDLLLKTDLDSEQHEYAKLVRTSGDTLLSVLNDILDFSKIEAGKLELDLSEFELGEAVEDVADLLAERAGAKGVELSVFVERDVPSVVCGDEVRLRQVLMNLVANAVKFTSEGEIAVRAERVSSADGLERVRFEVADTGIGIAPERAREVFDSFSQADSSTSRHFGGTGLGLSISSQLVELMGGQIGVESVPGEGSTFWFELSLRAGEGEGLEGGSRSRPDLRGRRLLVVDDTATNRVIVAHYAATWGLEVQEADSGEQALDLLRAAAEAGRPIDILALDFQMPGMDGTAVAREVRADERLRSTQIVLMSSSAERPPELREHGLDGHVPKPVRRARLRRAFLKLSDETAQPRVRTRQRRTGRGLKVLVAEDHPVNQLLAVRMLEERGLLADVVEDGASAIEAFERGGYAAVLMDCQMPGMDGYEATRQIRLRESAGRRVPIIAMTAHSMTGDRERCLDAGMDDYVAKPLDADAFDAALARSLAGSDSGAATRWGAHGSPPTGPANDLEALVRVRDDVGAELHGTLCASFFDDADRTLEEMRDAVSRADAEGLRQRAHRLRGAAATLGARAPSKTAQRLEEGSAAGEVSGALVERLALELERTRSDIGGLADARGAEVQDAEDARAG